jgi:pilus assembly protein Flp/PilA
MLESLKKLIKDEEAPTAVEYALMASLVAVGIIVSVVFLRDRMGETFTRVADHLG